MLDLVSIRGIVEHDDKLIAAKSEPERFAYFHLGMSLSRRIGGELMA